MAKCIRFFFNSILSFLFLFSTEPRHSLNGFYIQLIPLFVLRPCFIMFHNNLHAYRCVPSLIATSKATILLIIINLFLFVRIRLFLVLRDSFDFLYMTLLGLHSDVALIGWKEYLLSVIRSVVFHSALS